MGTQEATAAPTTPAAAIAAPEATAVPTITEGTTTSGATSTTDPQGAVMAELARNQLAGERGVAPDRVGIIKIESVEWHDSALGCPSEGTMALQVITPGYLIVLRVNGTDYIYHTDTQQQVLRCEQ